jgi:beta-glucanase (GH16 family)
VEELESRAVPSVLVWSDEFDGPINSAPDPAKWGYDLGGGGWGNHELEVYTNSLQNAFITADPDATDGKALAIRAIRQADGTYTSARLKTQNIKSWTYGRFEARAKLPYGQGMWPAFWMLGSNIGSVGWPTCGEVDVMENIGREPSTIHGTMHGPGYSGGSGIGAAYSLPGGQRFRDAYHVFAVDWTPTAIRWYVDDQLYETRTRADLPPGRSWVFDHSFFVLLNLAVGGDWPGNPDGSTVFPQTYLVDYVRIYADVPSTWSDTDIGNPGRVGGAAFDSASGTWTVAGGGSDIWGTSDQFNFASQAYGGDGSLVARVTSLQDTDPWAKAGVMFRDSSGVDAAFASVFVTPANGVIFEWRNAAGVSAQSAHGPGLGAPVWVQVTRSANVFTASYSVDDSNWTQVGSSQTIVLNPTTLAGLAVTAHNNTRLNTATFDNVALIAPIDLSGGYNQAGLAGDGTPFSGGGLDGNGNAYSANLLGPSVASGGVTFNLGATGGNNVVQAQGQTVALPAGPFSALTFLGTGVNGIQSNQTFTVRYTDGTGDTFTQDVSDWLSPQGYAGESVAAALGYYNAADGSSPGVPNYLYQYRFSINRQKTISSITLPNNGNVMILAIDLIS